MHTRTAVERLAFRRALRRDPSDAEHELWTRIRRGALGAKFRRQHPVGPYVLDFYCAEHRLAVELDGSQHGWGDAQLRDEARTAYLSSRGISVLRFTNAEMLEEEEAVIRVLRQAIGYEDDP